MFSSRQTNSKAGRGVIRQGSALPVRCVQALLIGVSLIALTFSSPAEAADEPTSRPAAAPADHAAISQWFSELASADPTTRDHARDRLMHLSRNELPELQELLRQSQHPAPSQIVALRQIVQEVYLAGEPYDKDTDANGTQHGFLGIMMDQDPGIDLQQGNDNGQAPGIIVAGRFPGFCAARTLRDGDVILASLNADNTPEKVFNSVKDLQDIISSADPGTIVRLQVLRQGQLIQIRLTLDCRPKEATRENAEEFCQKRLGKFDEYWRETFAPLLKESVG